MPKIAKTEREKRADNMKAVIAYNLVKNGLTKRQFIERCGFSVSGYYDCEKEPELFRVRDLYKMSNVLNIKIETLLGCEQPGRT